jgi:methylated-DNA-[protein]-cysteine S-methyltransferase
MMAPTQIEENLDRHEISLPDALLRVSTVWLRPRSLAAKEKLYPIKEIDNLRRLRTILLWIERIPWLEIAREAHNYVSSRLKHRGRAVGQAVRHYRIFETANGFCGIAWNELGVIRFRLPATSAAAAERALLRRLPGAQLGAPPPEVDETIAAAKRYFEGERTDFSDVKLDLDDQDAFFQKVYAAVRRLGWGHTTTYGTVAKELGTGPETARDIGQAMAKNPVPLIIPCHRVLGAGGKVGGFSAPGGAAAKRRMLELEGVHIEPPRPVQQSFSI